MAKALINLFLFCDRTASERIPLVLQDSLSDLGYELYDPFAAMLGKIYSKSVKLFISPHGNGCTRILGDLDERIVPTLSSLGLSLLIALDDGNARIETYGDGEALDPLKALTPHLRDGCNTDNLQAVFSGDFVAVGAEAKSDIPLDMLPGNLQEMAGRLNPKHVNKMFNKIAGKIGKRVSGDGDAALGMFSGEAAKWDSAGGQKIAALMACLRVPDAWREPDFVALRGAYQLHLRRQRNPKAMLYPGDADAMDAVPDALAYAPVYGGMLEGIGKV